MGQDVLFLAIVSRVTVFSPFEHFHINTLMLIYILIGILSRKFFSLKKCLTTD